MFKFFKKKKITPLVIKCDTNSITINEKELSFPATNGDLIDILGKPSRVIEKSSTYLIWDDQGVFCAYTDPNNIVSINIYQNKKDQSEYNTKNQFKGSLFLSDEEITHKEFSRISLDQVVIYRLGSESETRFGFSLGLNVAYKKHA